MGYIFGGIIIVEDDTKLRGKLNFWREFNKSAVLFDSIKTYSVGEYK
jgi:hypothetical protein